jgi:hypothetical protein
MNWHDIQQLEALQTRLKNLGYVMRPSKYSYSGECRIGVYPLDDNLPIYSRDAELFAGDTEMIMVWIRGIEHRNEYLEMLKVTTKKKIKTLEEKYIKTRLQKAMLHKIKDPDVPLDKHTQDLIGLRNK